MGSIKLGYQGQPGPMSDVPARTSTERIGWGQLVNVPEAFNPAPHRHVFEEIDGAFFGILGPVIAVIRLMGAAYCRAGVWEQRGASGSLAGRMDVTYYWHEETPGDPPLPVGGMYAIPGHDRFVTLDGRVLPIEGTADLGRVDVLELDTTWDVERAADAGRVDVAELSASWTVERTTAARVDVAELSASWTVERVTDSTKPKGLLGGSGGRTLGDSLGILDSVIKPGVITAKRTRFTVIEVDWDVLQAAPGSLVASKKTALLADIATARANGLNVLLRVFMGFRAPQFVKDEVGILGFRDGGSEPRWYTNDGADGDLTKPAPSNTATNKAYALKKPMPDWTAPQYAVRAREFMELLAAAVGDEPNVVVVSMSWPMTQYAEPCIKQFGVCVENRIAATQAWVKSGGDWVLKAGGGWTLERELAVWTAGFTAHRDLWSPRGVATACAFNPLQKINTADNPPTMMAGDTAATNALMDQMLDIVGPRFAVLENNSVAAVLEGGSWKWDSYADMYAHMRDLHLSTGVRLHLQTETKVKHQKKSDPVSPLNTHKYAAVWGASSVEITRGAHLAASRVSPGKGSGWAAWTAAEAAAVNDALTANAPAWF